LTLARLKLKLRKIPARIASLLEEYFILFRFPDVTSDIDQCFSLLISKSVRRLLAWLCIRVFS